LGGAPEAAEHLPPLSAAFIGGSSGRLGEIFDALLGKNPRVRIAVNAVTTETLHEAMRAFAKHGVEPDIVQIGVTRAKPVGGLHMLQAASPVFILSGGKCG
jgi:precorrin-6Y C5,15-methyltransferase (decarboxylating)